MRQLRPWQAEALPIILSELDNRAVVKAVMGSGKSVLMAEVCKALPDYTILITAPSVRLVEQLADTISEHAGEVVGRIYTHGKTFERITVVCTSDSSLTHYFERQAKPDLWIADEAHKTERSDMLRFKPHLDPLRRLGFTATPFLNNENRSIYFFEKLAYDYTAAQSLADGITVDFAADYGPGGKGELNALCLDFIRRAAGSGIANAIDINDAEGFVRFLNQNGIAAKAIHSRQSKTEQAEAVLALASERIKCLVHVNMLTEGVDIPSASWLCARNKSRKRVEFAQEIGRLLRSHPGKTHAVIFDPYNLTGKFQLDYEACLGGAGDIIEREGLDSEESDIVPRMHEDMVEMIDPVARYIQATHRWLVARGCVRNKIRELNFRQPSPMTVASIGTLASRFRSRFPKNREHLEAMGQVEAILRTPGQSTITAGHADMLHQILAHASVHGLSVTPPPSDAVMQGIRDAVKKSSNIATTAANFFENLPGAPRYGR